MSFPAGLMVNRIRFETRAAATDDGYGNTLAAWSTRSTLWAAFQPEVGRESLEAGRLESTLRGVVTLHRSSLSLAITAADRGVFTAGPYADTVFQIRSIVPRPDAATIELVIEAGVAT